jgi:hypothetical protein
LSCVLAYPDVRIEEDAVEDFDGCWAGLDRAKPISKELALVKPLKVKDFRVPDLIEAKAHSGRNGFNRSDGIDAAIYWLRFRRIR